MTGGEGGLDGFLSRLRALAEPSRLRLFAVCAHGEWTVTELVHVMGQSQPRISRHLKVLAEAGLLERFREGSWVFYRHNIAGAGADLARRLVDLLPQADAQLALDRLRLQAVREARRRQAERWFDERAQGWDSERDLGVEGTRVEAALHAIFAAEPAETAIDIGTGTGRMLQVMAPHIKMGVGLDLSRDMLAIARAQLDRRELRHCQVRQGDMYQLPFGNETFSSALLHQVLHFADDPLAVLTEARRVLRPGGRLIVADLAQHDQEWLRSERLHRRLGFPRQEMSGWFDRLGLVEDPPIGLPGGELSVVIWVARDLRKINYQLSDGNRRDAA